MTIDFILALTSNDATAWERLQEQLWDQGIIVSEEEEEEEACQE